MPRLIQTVAVPASHTPSKKRLRELARRKSSDFSLTRCRYSKDQHKTVAKVIVEEALRKQPDAYTKMLAEKGDESAKSAIRCALSNTLRWMLVGKSAIIKNGAFKSEREWRLISKPRSDNYKATRKFRVHNGLIVSYLEFSLDDADLWRQARVCVGPCPHPEQAKDFVRMLLMSELTGEDGRGELPTACAGRINNSSVPYRYW
jgi:hypothetical protein